MVVTVLTEEIRMTTIGLFPMIIGVTIMII